MSAWPDLVGSGIGDVLAAFQIPGSNLAGAAVSAGIGKLLNKRAEQARAIFLEELADGLRAPRDPGDVDEFVAITYRYLTKAQEGAARLNLRLMARVIRGQLEGPALYASEFLRYSELLATLNREEVIVLATRHRLRLEHDASKRRDDWNDTSIVNRSVEKALVPKVFPSRDHLDAALTALQRTGLVWPAGHGAPSTGVPIWKDSPLLDELVQLAGFDEALQREPTPTRACT